MPPLQTNCTDCDDTKSELVKNKFIMKILTSSRLQAGFDIFGTATSVMPEIAERYYWSNPMFSTKFKHGSMSVLSVYGWVNAVE